MVVIGILPDQSSRIPAQRYHAKGYPWVETDTAVINSGSDSRFARSRTNGSTDGTQDGDRDNIKQLVCYVWSSRVCYIGKMLCETSNRLCFHGNPPDSHSITMISFFYMRLMPYNY